MTLNVAVFAACTALMIAADVRAAELAMSTAARSAPPSSVRAAADVVDV